MRVFAATLLLLATLWPYGSARAQKPEPASAIAKLNTICEVKTRLGCTIELSIEGFITTETARSFSSLLDLEQRRSGSTLRPVLTIQSTGGDLYAAIAIGREIRKRTGAVISTGPCHSACVFVAMGGVERNVAGIGLHRPYFAHSETNLFTDADARYKRMLRLISDYLAEMNISEDLLRMMVSVPPGEMRLLPQTDARRIGLNGIDPAFDEFRTGQEAVYYGISSAELRRRHASLDVKCGREEDMRSLPDLRKRDECRTTLRERILWGFDEKTFALLNRAVTDHCHGTAHESPERLRCMRTLAESIRREETPPNVSQPTPRAP